MFYQRHLDPEGEDSLARLLRRIPKGTSVLELGPATGYCSRYLHEALGCTVDAVELSAEMAEQARPWCRRLVVGNVEELDLEQVLGGQAYEIILCADVIEHLHDPWSLVRKLSQRITPGGRLLLSVPNVGYLGLLVDLLRGNFRYRDEGLLDRTHLRFFTFDSLRELLEQAGWHVWAAEQVTLSLTDSEFRVRLETLSPALRDELLARSDALCYQWVVEARRSPAPQPVVLQRAPSEDCFQVRVFWRDEEGGFDYPQDRLVWAALGRENQTVALDIPAGQQALALRLSDRIGFVRLRGIRLMSDGNIPLWEWALGRETLPVARRIEVEAASDDGLWFVAGTESRLVLDLPAATVAITRRIELVIDAPLSADFLAAKAYWSDPQGLPAQLADCRASCERMARRRSGDVYPRETSELPKMLHVLQAGGGGVVRFVRDLCDATANRFHHFVLHVTGSSWLLEDTLTASYWPFPGDGSASVLHGLSGLHPVLIHLHSTAPAPMKAAKALRDQCGVPMGITLHDVLFADPMAFQSETWPSAPLLPDDERRHLLSDALFLTAPSRFVAGLAQRTYGVSVTVVPNGIDLLPSSEWQDDGEVEVGGRYWARRVVALGALGGHKGANHLFDVASRLPEDMVIVVFGYLDGQLDTGWAHEHHRNLAMHPGASRIFITGPYAPVDLPALFRHYRPQLVYFPARIPESFGYTLSETWACGGVPVIPKLGALGERTTTRTAVKLPRADDAGAVAACLDDWSRPTAKLRRAALRQRVRATLPDLNPSLHDMARTFSEIYERLAVRAPGPADAGSLSLLSELCEMNLDPAQFRSELRLMLEENRTLRAQDEERARWNSKLEAGIAELKARNTEVEQQLAALAQANQELAQVQEENRALRAQDEERARWNSKLEAGIAELKARNTEVEQQLAALAQANQELAQVQEENRALRAQHEERVRWNSKLETGIAELKARNTEVEQQLAELAQVRKEELAQFQEENQALRTQDQERARWNRKLEADIAELKARNTEVEQQLAELAQARKEELAQIQEENQALLAQNQERARWISKLEAGIAELKARNTKVEQQLAGLAQAHQEQTQTAQRYRQELEKRDARLAAACAALGEDESAWPRYGRIVRLAKRVPGLFAGMDRLAALRRR